MHPLDFLVVREWAQWGRSELRRVHAGSNPHASALGGDPAGRDLPSGDAPLLQQPRLDSTARLQSRPGGPGPVGLESRARCSEGADPSRP
jgi:hypothetical protein